MLQQKLKELAELYVGLEIIKTVEQSKDEQLKALPEYQELEKIREGKKQQESDIENLRAEVKNLTMEAYLVDGNKKPAPGVGIRIMKEYIYSAQLPFVSFEEYPTATIASDLTEYLDV